MINCIHCDIVLYVCMLKHPLITLITIRRQALQQI